jgi:hypothetical protein
MRRLRDRHRVGPGERLFKAAIELFIKPAVLSRCAFLRGVAFDSAAFASLASVTHHRLLWSRRNKRSAR